MHEMKVISVNRLSVYVFCLTNGIIYQVKMIFIENNNNE